MRVMLVVTMVLVVTGGEGRVILVVVMVDACSDGDHGAVVRMMMLVRVML